MGCISSKKQVDDNYPNIFQVMNVDEHGNLINPGQLEITDVDLVLYQHGKPPIKWPLRTLRRYGFDSEHFSFESGRRCQTGPGIYAFRCRRAEQLFNMLQSRIQLRNIGEITTEGSENVPSLPMNREPNYLEPNSAARRPNVGPRFSSQNGILLPSSTASNSAILGPTAPQTTAPQSSTVDSNTLVSTLPIPRPISQNLYVNEEVIASASQDLEETVTNIKIEEPVLPPFRNSITNSVTLESLPVKNMSGDSVQLEPAVESGHLYMNITPGIGNVMPQTLTVRSSNGQTLPHPKSFNVPVDWESEEPIHSYANFEAQGCVSSMTASPTPIIRKNLNYIVLDLEPCSDNLKTIGTQPPESPRKPAGGYAAIDFKKTVALSHSVNPIFDNDSEGSRKTRHNSNINDLISHTRHSSSVSD